MPIAQVRADTDWHELGWRCANCGAQVFSELNSWEPFRESYRHMYPGPWFGQMICDPQQARAALKGKA